jgi:hypothetical protein
MEAERPVLGVAADEPGDDEMAGRHADRSGDEDGLSAEFVDVEHCGDGEDKFKNAYDAGGEEGGGGAAKAEVVEDEGGVI